jgi:hypothetical protein
MAQAVPNSVIHKIRNALGNVVFYERGGQLYTRARVSPSQAPTTARTRVRANLAAISAAWKSTLTEAQRQAWRTASLTAPQNPQRNNRGTRSGWTYYQQVNLTRLNLSLAQTATPPALQNTDPPTAFSVNTLDGDAPSILLDVTGAEGEDTYLIVYASPNRPPGYFTANGKTGQVQVFAPGAARPLDLTAAWQAKYGTLTPGSRINFQIASANAIDGRLTARQYATAIISGSGILASLLGYIAPDTLTPPVEADFTWTNQNTVTTDLNSKNCLQLTNGTGSLNLLSTLTKPLGTWNRIVVGYLTSPNTAAGSSNYGLCLKETATGKYITAGFQFVNGNPSWSIDKWSAYNSYSASYQTVSGANAAFLNPIKWVIIEKSGTDLLFSYSPDGQLPNLQLTKPINDFFTTEPDEWGIFGNTIRLGKALFIHAAIT